MAEWFIHVTHSFAVDARSIRSQVGLFPLGSGFLRSVTSFPFVGFLFVVTRLGIIIDGNDAVDNLANNKVLVNVNASETTDVLGDAGNFIEMLKKKSQ